jgi:hypothetical protein
MSSSKKSKSGHATKKIKPNRFDIVIKDISRPNPQRSIIDIFMDPSYRNIVQDMLPFIGTEGRRTFGMSSKTIYESMGGKEKATKDYARLKVQKDVQKILHKLQGKFKDYDTFQYALKYELLNLDFDYQVDDKLNLSEELKQNYLENEEFYKQSFQA